MRSKKISFRATVEEVEILRLMCKRENRDLSEMVRELIREGATARQLLPAGLVSFESIRGKYDRNADSRKTN